MAKPTRYRLASLLQQIFGSVPPRAWARSASEGTGGGGASCREWRQM